MNISADGFVHLRTSVKLTFGPFASYRFVQRVSSQRDTEMLQHYIGRRESIKKAETILYVVKLKHVSRAAK